MRYRGDSQQVGGCACFAKSGLGAAIPQAKVATLRWYEALSARPTFKVQPSIAIRAIPP